MYKHDQALKVGNTSNVHFGRVGYFQFANEPECDTLVLSDAPSYDFLIGKTHKLPSYFAVDVKDISLE